MGWTGLVGTETDRTAPDRGWGNPVPPEELPRVTVRWEDPDKERVFVVEGGAYSCRVDTQPARILSLECDGQDVLKGQGLDLAFVDESGVVYRPAPAELVPQWEVWIGQGYKRAPHSRARMNVWSAGPYYQDAHLLDIPFMSETAIAAHRNQQDLPTLREWRLPDQAEGWEALQDCELHVTDTAFEVLSDGADPFFQGPEISVAGPVSIRMRLYADEGGGAALYYCTDDAPDYGGDRVQTFSVPGGKWHEATVELADVTRLTRFRIDPPGQKNRVRFAWIRVLPLPPPLPPEDQPVRGELVFHTYADRLNLEFRLDPAPGQAAPVQALWRSVRPTSAPVLLDRRRPAVLFGSDPGAVAVLGTAGSRFEDGHWTAPLSGTRPGTHWTLRPGRDPDALFLDELSPLASDAVAVTDGHWLGYDPPSGLYLVESTGARAAFSFEAAYKVPNRRMASTIRLRNDQTPRSVVVKCLSGVGNLEASVLTDTAGFPLPVPALICKNFGGEMEEPDDSGYGDAYFPLDLAPLEEREFQVLHLFQNWGDHMLKQVSSIRFFQIYWHLSTGLSETTCFTLAWWRSGQSYYRIPDFRPMSGPMFPSQPQHGCEQFPGFLQYNRDTTRLVYERTVFHQISPNLARFTLHYHTSDGAATGHVTAMEIPQRDEMRTFLRMRYDWHRPVKIEGDAREEFRWMNMNHWAARPELLLWSERDGETRIQPLEGDGPQLVAEELCDTAPFIGAHGSDDRYHAFLLVQSFRARLGGRDRTTVVASASARSAGAEYWLGVDESELELQPGDFIEADIMLMPHGERTVPGFKEERERDRYGLNAPRVTAVDIGEALGQFPAEIRARDEVAAFTIDGGYDYLPFIVEGFASWKVPLLWKDSSWQDQQVHGGDGYQVEPDGNGGYRFTFVYPGREGQTHRFLVTRAASTAGIQRVFDRNGRVVLEAGGTGRFELKAPVLFGPGTNRLAAGDPVVAFSGEAARVEQVPVTASVAEGECAVVLLPADGDSREAAGGMLEVNLPAGSHRVRVRVLGH
jgi:hypothetical protein